MRQIIVQRRIISRSRKRIRLRHLDRDIRLLKPNVLTEEALWIRDDLTVEHSGGGNVQLIGIGSGHDSFAVGVGIVLAHDVVVDDVYGARP